MSSLLWFKRRALTKRARHTVIRFARARASLVCRRVGDDARRQVIDRLLTQLESAARCCLMRDAALVKRKEKKGGGGGGEGGGSSER